METQEAVRLMFHHRVPILQWCTLVDLLPFVYIDWMLQTTQHTRPTTLLQHHLLMQVCQKCSKSDFTRPARSKATWVTPAFGLLSVTVIPTRSKTILSVHSDLLVRMKHTLTTSRTPRLQVLGTLLLDTHLIPTWTSNWSLLQLRSMTLQPTVTLCETTSTCLVHTRHQPTPLLGTTPKSQSLRTS